MNITFYTDNIDPRIPEMQKKVFEKFGLEITQINPGPGWEGHGGTIDKWIGHPERFEKYGLLEEVVILWDTDCIPLNANIVHEAVKRASRGEIMGVAQKASHIPNSIIYAGPAFLAFSLKTYIQLGSPTFACTERSDCAGEMTHAALEKGVKLTMLYPSHVEKPEWPLTDNIMFGKGTTFENSIYHAFLSRKGNAEMFLKKCEEVLSTDTK